MLAWWEKIVQALQDATLPVAPVSSPRSGELGAWERIGSSEGPIATFRLGSWSTFFDFLESEVFKPLSSHAHKYIWRGQRHSDWSLSSSLDRWFDKLGVTGNLEDRTREHLESFKYATRGRRSSNPAPVNENDWWALGQHFGLSTPLLDWTTSPFAAAYFAFEEPSYNPTPFRVVYGLDRKAVHRRSNELLEAMSVERGRPAVVEFVEPMSDDNPRLVSQGGLFTRSPLGTPIERWVEEVFEDTSGAILLRIEIPDSDRLTCLRALDRMNINHLSLFPDLSGASRSTNLRMELESR